MNKPPEGPTATRPQQDLSTVPATTDWEVVDVHTGQVIATKYEPTSPDYPEDDPPMSAQGAAEALSGELNALEGAWTLDTEQLREEARRLRIEGLTV